MNKYNFNIYDNQDELMKGNIGLRRVPLELLETPNDVNIKKYEKWREEFLKEFTKEKIESFLYFQTNVLENRFVKLNHNFFELHKGKYNSEYYYELYSLQEMFNKIMKKVKLMRKLKFHNISKKESNRIEEIENKIIQIELKIIDEVKNWYSDTPMGRVEFFGLFSKEYSSYIDDQREYLESSIVDIKRSVYQMGNKFYAEKMRGLEIENSNNFNGDSSLVTENNLDINGNVIDSSKNNGGSQTENNYYLLHDYIFNVGKNETLIHGSAVVVNRIFADHDDEYVREIYFSGRKEGIKLYNTTYNLTDETDYGVEDYLERISNTKSY